MELLLHYCIARYNKLRRLLGKFEYPYNNYTAKD